MLPVKRFVLGSILALLASVASAHADVERWFINEEWYDWHAWKESTSHEKDVYRVEVHFVGPGAVTPRGIYVRGDADALLERIFVDEIKDHRKQPLKTESSAVEAASVPAGKKWVRLAQGEFTRGYTPLALHLPAGCKVDYVCVSPNERYFTDGRAEEWIGDHERGKEVRCGMPLGGIGAGKVEIARDGWLRNITTNNNIDTPFYHPALCFLAAEIDGKQKVLRDQSAPGLPSAKTITFDARYPIAHLTFRDPEWPIPVQVTAWSPIIPHKLSDSCLPVAVFEFTLENTTDSPIAAAVAISWEHLIGSGGRPQPAALWRKSGHYLKFCEQAGNVFERVPGKPGLLGGLVFKSGAKSEPDGEGNYALIAGDERELSESDCLAWSYDAPQATDRWARMAIGSVDQSLKPGQAAALTVRMKLEPGQKRTIPFAFAWYMDHFFQMGKTDLGHFYSVQFPDAKSVAFHTLLHRKELFDGTHALQDLFDRTDLPRWFTSMLLNDLYALSTDTWLTRDGRFSVNEGATSMFGTMGTMDQKLYASQHLALLFPDLQKKIREFGQLQHPDGGITHDLGTGKFVETNEAFDWPDLGSAFSLLSWQVYRETGDKPFWEEMRPRVLKAIEALATTYDPERLGVPGHGSTFDDEDSYRIFSYTTGLWLCDLRLGMEIARQIHDDAKLAEYERHFERARELAMKELWTGSYFRYGSSPPPENKRTDASHFSQLAGEFWARLLGFDGIFEPTIRKTALAGTLRMHWGDRFKLPPKIVLPDGRLFPRDDAHRNAPVSWPMHSRALLCGNAFLFGMEEQGWDLLKAMHDNIIAANGPDPWDQSLYYDPISGRYDWGVFYMTGPASWLAYQALVDTRYDAIDESLTMRQPTAVAKVAPGRFPVITPVFWAIGECTRGSKTLRLNIVKVFTPNHEIQSIRVDTAYRRADLRLDGRQMECSLKDGQFKPARSVPIREGTQIEIVLDK